MALLKIGGWTVDGTDGTLTSAAGVTRLEPRVVAVLMRLAESRGAVVSQDDLLRDVWRDTHVAPGALARTIFLLRQALGDDVRQPRYIQTVPKRGYRLIATVEEANVPPPHASPRWRSIAALAAAVFAAVTVADDVKTTPNRVRAEPRYTNQTRLGNENAFAYYTRAVALDASSSDAHAGLATAYAFRANYLRDTARWAAVAIDEATRATTLDAGSAGAIRALATAHFQARHFREAVRQYTRALAIDPADYASHMNLGLVLMASGRLADAVAVFERGIAKSPERPPAYAYLSRALILAGHLREAVHVARAATALEPYAAHAQLVLARVDLHASRYDAARARLERLLEVRADCAQCLVQLGLIDELLGRPSAAEARYRAARAIEAPFPAAALRLARLAARSGRAAEADALLQEVETNARAAIDNGFEDQEPPWLLAVAAAIRGDRAAALQWYREAMKAGRRDGAWDRFEPMLALVQHDAAFVALQQPARDEHDAVALRVDPILRTVAAADAQLGGRLLLDGPTDDPPGWSTHRSPADRTSR